MTMKVQIMYEEMIKPSSPTPHHLRTLKLSLLEQVAPLEYVPVIYYFHSSKSNTTGARSDRLRKSLSETLTRFYPLAGRTKDNSSIECNDDGVLYIEAQVINCHLMEFLTDPDLSLLNHFLPFDVNRSSIDVQLAVQVNNFECGGIALGVCVLHKIIDCATLSTFVNAWAATTARASNEAVVLQPSFISASLFPPRDFLNGFMVSMSKLNHIGNFITTRYVFDESNIKALKLKASINGGFDDKPPTTVEVITALIWRSAMAASRARHGGSSPRPSMVAHAVNVRARAVEPLPQHSMGSIVTLATAYSSATGSDDDEKLSSLHGLVRLVREAIKKINGDYIRKVQGEDENGFLMLWESFRKEAELFNDDAVDCYWFTSWRGFPLYEADFGWGKPLWISSASFPKRNFVVLMEGKGCDGMEAWVTLDEREMAFFEKDQDLQAFSQQKYSCNPVAATL